MPPEPTATGSSALVPERLADAIHETLGSTDLADLLADVNRDRVALSVVIQDPVRGILSRFDGRENVATIPTEHTKFLESMLAAPSSTWESIEGRRVLAPSEPPIRAVAALTFRAETYGLALLHGEDPLDLAAWQPVVPALASQIVKIQLYEGASREALTARMKIEALNEVGELIRYVDLEVLLTKLMELSVRIVRAEVGAIVLSDSGRLRTGVEWGLSERVLTSLRTRSGESFLDAVLAAGQPVLVEEAGNSPWIDRDGLAVELESIFAIPLISHSETLGLVVVANAAGEGWEESGTEILSTVANLSAAAVQNAVLYRNAIELERISAEMKLASDVQASMLPRCPPKRPGVEFAGWNIPCDETGGDYYDFLDMGAGRTGIVIGDATGHGMGAALMMFVVRSSLRALLTQREDLVEVVQTMNDLVEESSEPHRFMTFFMGIVDESARTLTYTNAGHDPPLVLRRSTREFVELTGAGVPLGVLPGSQYRVDTASLEPGDLWIFGTDGIWEARNSSGEFFGKERFQDLARSVDDLPVEEASRRLREEVVAFHGGAEQRDDITAVLMRVLG